MEKLHPKNWIKELRDAKNLTAEQLGGKIGKSGPFITMLEKRKRGLTWPTIQKLADALECHPSEITDGPVTEPIKKIMSLVQTMSEADQERFMHMAEAFTGIEAASKGKK